MQSPDRVDDPWSAGPKYYLIGVVLWEPPSFTRAASELWALNYSIVEVHL